MPSSSSSSPPPPAALASPSSFSRILSMMMSARDRRCIGAGPHARDTGGQPLKNATRYTRTTDCSYYAFNDHHNYLAGLVRVNVGQGSLLQERAHERLKNSNAHQKNCRYGRRIQLRCTAATIILLLLVHPPLTPWILLLSMIPQPPPR